MIYVTNKQDKDVRTYISCYAGVRNLMGSYSSIDIYVTTSQINVGNITLNKLFQFVKDLGFDFDYEFRKIGTLGKYNINNNCLVITFTKDKRQTSSQFKHQSFAALNLIRLVWFSSYYILAKNIVRNINKLPHALLYEYIYKELKYKHQVFVDNYTTFTNQSYGIASSNQELKNLSDLSERISELGKDYTMMYDFMCSFPTVNKNFFEAKMKSKVVILPKIKPTKINESKIVYKQS